MGDLNMGSIINMVESQTMNRVCTAPLNKDMEDLASNLLSDDTGYSIGHKYCTT